MVKFAKNLLLRSAKKRIGARGFTLIELTMVMLLLSVVSASVVPNFIDFRTDAKNAALKGILGGVRSAIAIGHSAIALKESMDVLRDYPYPHFEELLNNVYMSAYHPVLAGTPIMSPTGGSLARPSGIPRNPWSTTQYWIGDQALTETFCDGFDAMVTGGLMPGVLPDHSNCISLLGNFIFDMTGAVNRQDVFDNNVGGDEAPYVGLLGGYGYSANTGDFFPFSFNNGFPAGRTEFWY